MLATEDTVPEIGTTLVAARLQWQFSEWAARMNVLPVLGLQIPTQSEYVETDSSAPTSP